MTAQLHERLRFRGEDYGMAAEPLEQAFLGGVTRPRFGGFGTACWRGYLGSWEVRDSCLYLIAIDATVPDANQTDWRTFGLTELFPNVSPGGVFADWCTDWLRVPRGEMMQYVHMGYDSKYERDLFLGVHCGRLIALQEVTNTDPPAVTRELTPRVEEAFPGEAPFIRALHANWADRLPRLVYADWLDERNDPRGELLRVDVELSKSPGDAALLARRKEVLESVKDRFWMKVVGCDPPRNEYGWEMRTW